MSKLNKFSKFVIAINRMQYESKAIENVKELKVRTVA
jgi:hypothetical protein